MSQRAAVDTLLDALNDVAPEIGLLHAHDRSRMLRAPTYAAVDELKSRGLSRARANLIILALAADAGIDAREPLAELAIWCAQRYVGDMT